MKRFTKTDLKSGDRIETRSGVRYIALKDSRSDVLLFSNGCYNSAKYDNDLLSTYSEQDIMKVFTPLKVADTLDLNAEVELIWERPSYSEMFDYIEGLK
jgi:hypothetical protein